MDFGPKAEMREIRTFAKVLLPGVNAGNAGSFRGPQIDVQIDHGLHHTLVRTHRDPCPAASRLDGFEPEQVLPLA